MFTQRFKFANYRVLIKIFRDIEDLCVVIKLGFWVTMLLAPSYPYTGTSYALMQKEDNLFWRTTFFELPVCYYEICE